MPSSTFWGLIRSLSSKVCWAIVICTNTHRVSKTLVWENDPHGEWSTELGLVPRVPVETSLFSSVHGMFLFFNLKLGVRVCLLWGGFSLSTPPPNSRSPAGHRMARMRTQCGKQWLPFDPLVKNFNVLKAKNAQLFSPEDWQLDVWAGAK